MKTKLILIAGIGAVVIAGMAYALTRPAPDNNAALSTPSPTAAANGTATPTAAGAYVDYRVGIIEATAGTKVLFFHAPWCPQCRKLEQSIKDGTIPAGATIIKVDYDSNQGLRQQYGVTIQTTLVRVDDSGGLVKRYVAYDKPSLAALEENLLK